MKGRLQVTVAAALFASALLAAGSGLAARLSVEIREPAENSVLPASQPHVEVVGGASIYGGVSALDLFLVLDSSESLRRTDPRDQRTAGVVALVESLHPKANIQIGVVDFDKKATRLTELTDDRDAVVAALHSLDQYGETDIAAGLRSDQPAHV